MKACVTFRWLLAGAILATGLLRSAAAQEVSNSAAQKSGESAVVVSPNYVSEVIKMLDAKVSKQLVWNYIESMPAPSIPGAADVIALKEHGVDDELISALLRRSAGARLQSQWDGQVAAKAAGSAGGASGARETTGPDPDSYEYFQNYYLYPRTLAAMNERLGYATVPYGYYAMPVRPYAWSPQPYSGFGGGYSLYQNRAFGHYPRGR